MLSGQLRGFFPLFDRFFLPRYNNGRELFPPSGERDFPGGPAGEERGSGLLTRGKKVFRVLLKIFGGLLSFAVLTLTCLSLILAQPQEDPENTPAPQPPLTASPSVMTQSESEIPALASSFPVPLMTMVSNSGLEFISALAQDVRAGDTAGRIATLQWQTQDGEPVILQSIYPASALSLLEGDYHFVGKLGPTLFGSASVYMENAAYARLHARTDSALYVVIVPKGLASRLTSLSQSLGLLSPQ